MLKNMINMVKKNYKLYLLFAMIVVIAFLPFIILNKGVMIFPGDSYEQVFKMWQGGHELFKSSQVSQFNWSLGFGGNLFSFSFYFLFDPFFYLSLLFPKEFIAHFILISSMIQMILGLIFAHMWLCEITENSKASAVGAFIIIFSGFTFFLLHYYHYTRFLLFYPLALYFVERFIKNRKTFGISLTLGILGITNYYLLYQFIPFLLLYTLFRYICVKYSIIRFKKIVYDAILFILSIILGVGLSSIVLIPTLYLVTMMPRFSNLDVGLFNHLSFSQLFKLLSSLFIPMSSRLDSNLFINSNYHASLGWGGGVSIYSLAITPLILPLVFKIKDKIEKYSILVFYLLLFIFLFFTKFTYLFQMAMETRWLYMFVLLNAYTVTKIISKQDYTFKNLCVSSILSTILSIFFIFITYKFQLNDVDNLNYLLLIVVINIIVLWLFTYALCNKSNGNILIFICLINIIFSASIFYYFNKPVNNKYIDYKYTNNSIEQFWDDGFYRVRYDLDRIDDFMITTSNDPFAHGYAGASFYSSIYNTNQEKFLNRFKSTWNMPENKGRNKVYNLLSFKYWYTTDLDSEVPIGYVYYKQLDNGIYVFKNTNYVELGFTYDKTINEKAVENLSYFEQDRIMQEYLVTENSLNYIYELQDSIKLLAKLPSDTIRVYEFDKPVNSVNIYIETFGIPYTKVELLRNNEIVKTLDFWQFNYVDFYVDVEIDTIVITGEDIYGNGTEINLYIEENVDKYKETFTNLTKNNLSDVIFDKDFISANIDINKNSTLFTSIPYEKGWKVYVDGIQTEYEKVNFGFIGVDISKGIHHIEFEYTIPYLFEGMCISSISLFGLFGLRLWRKKYEK